jgi:nucleotide-binding universal stress UspA family protein
MKSILVLSPPEDRASRAVRLASELARKTDSSLTLLRVLEEGIRWNPQRRSTDRGHEIRDLLIRAEMRELENVAAPLREEGIEVDVRVAWGVTWEAVVEHAREGNFDLVVKPARGLGREGRVFFGSTALHLFRKSPCPVWVVGDDGRPPARILAAVDPADDATRRTIADRILQSAVQIGEWNDDASVHVGAAWHAPAAEALKGRIEASELQEYLDDNRDRSQRALEFILQKSAPSVEPSKVHLLEGLARDVLPNFAEESHFDLIVIGALGRTGVAGELLGETAEMILRQVRCSVLVLSPGHRALTAATPS